MSATPVYLDQNASSPLRPAALEAMVESLRAGGNPSSVHRAGRAARARIEAARRQVAALVGALGYDQFALVKELLRDRPTIVWGVRLARAPTTADRAAVSRVRARASTARAGSTAARSASTSGRAARAARTVCRPAEASSCSWLNRAICSSMPPNRAVTVAA